MTVEAEMPRYQSHKKVWALKIAKIEPVSVSEGHRITPEDKGYAPFNVPLEYVMRHKPEVGGYYVVYEDGYKSWSPAEAFESGYTRV